MDMLDELRIGVFNISKDMVKKGVFLEDANDDAISVVICNEGRDEEECRVLALELKVQMTFLLNRFHPNGDNTVKVRYRLVDKNEYNRMADEAVQKMMRGNK